MPLGRIAAGEVGVKGEPAGRCATLDPDLPGSTGGGVMNDPEVTMLEAPSNQLVVLTTALEAAGLALRLARTVPAPLRSLSDQVVRSASSVAANLSEGHGRSGRDRLQHWRIAYGSAKEVDVHLRLLAGAGAVDAAHAQVALDLFDQVRAMTWRLLHPSGRAA